MLAKRICTFRHPIVFKKSRARHDDAIVRRQPGCDQRAVLKIAHPHHQIEPLRYRVGQSLGEVQFDVQARMFPRERCQDGDDVAFSECRETGDPQHATDRAIESGNLGMGIGEIVKQALGTLKQVTARVRQRQRPGRANEESNAQVLF